MDGMKITGQLITRGTDEVVFHDAYVLVVDGEVERIEALMPLLQHVRAAGRSLLIVALDIHEDAVTQIERLEMRRSPTFRAIKAPGFGTTRRDLLGDIEALTGAPIVSPTRADLSMEQLGRAGRVEIGATVTTLADGKGASDRCYYYPSAWGAW